MCSSSFLSSSVHLIDFYGITIFLQVSMVHLYVNCHFPLLFLRPASPFPLPSRCHLRRLRRLPCRNTASIRYDTAFIDDAAGTSPWLRYAAGGTWPYPFPFSFTFVCVCTVLRFIHEFSLCSAVVTSSSIGSGAHRKYWFQIR